MPDKDSSITTTTSQGQPEDTDCAGAVDTVLGYTANSVIPRDSRGHMVFSSPDQIDPGHDECYAKLVVIKRSEDNYYSKYFIKIGVDGQIFNPWGMFSEGTQGQFNKVLGKPKWDFTEVKEKCFEFYIKFLQSRNNAWLNNAEREIR
tara:strand:+ start:926 stop:1366 length:441 start_codon:yes stop_codon:yes gene_type:complete